MLRFKHIETSLAIAILLLVGAATASAQINTMYANQPFTFEVDVQTAQEENIIWEVYEDFAGVNLAAVPGITSATYFPSGNTGSAVSIVFPVPGLYIVKVRAINDCPTDNMEVWLVEVLPALPVATILPPGEICEGDELVLEIEFTGTAPWEFDLFDGVITTTTYTAPATPHMTVVIPNPTTTTTYTVTRVTDVNGTNTTPSNSVTVIVNPQPVFNSPIYSVP